MKSSPGPAPLYPAAMGRRRVLLRSVSVAAACAALATSTLATRAACAAPDEPPSAERLKSAAEEYDRMLSILRR